jgi:serine/threonine protein kinase
MLPAGTKLGPYEILAPLGAGGMGEVYRARDTRLGRDVAIKTLPATFARNSERRARFETEARAVGALSHRNVLSLYDIGTEGDIAYAVMELVEGETLRERLMDGAIPGSRAVSLAIQIAQGLAAAHDKGVIHRDLKPENIIVTPEGDAKILDFGLAKREVSGPQDSASLAPTAVMATEPGVVLGTTGYMSPEQVRGSAADPRSDIFSLGAVIYEMLSGRRAFHAGSPADTMSAILREDPPDLTQLVPDVSPGVERIVRRCLEKHPSGRFRSAADLAFALEAVSSGSASTKSGVGSTAGVAAPSLRFKRLTYRLGTVAGARFVSGGSGVVYGASWEGRPFEVFTAFPGSPEARSLGLPPANVLSISSTGEMALSVGYHHNHWNQVTGMLARTSVAGGGVRALQKDVVHAEWSPDGKTMAIIRFVDGICRLEYPAGTVLFETPDWLSRPCVSPDGSLVAFGYHAHLGETTADVCVIGPGGPHRVLMSNLSSLSGMAWSPSGEEVWCSGIHDGERNGIRAVRLDGKVRDIYISPARVYLHDLARDGRALMSLGSLRLGMGVSTEDSGRDVDLSWFDGSVASDISADGRQVMFWECAEAGNPNYASYLRDLDGSPAVRIGDGTTTRFSPDAQWALAITLRPTHGLWLYPIGLGEPRPIPIEGVERIVWAGFHPDGRRLFVAGSTPGRAKRLYLLPIEGGRPELLWDEPIEFDRVLGPPVSPDGHRLVIRRASGEPLMVSLDGSAKPLPALGANDKALRFDDTGRYLYVAAGDVGDRRIDRLDLESGERTLWRRLQPRDPTGIVFIGDPVITPDGSCLVYTYFRQLSDLYLVEGLA